MSRCCSGRRWHKETDIARFLKIYIKGQKCHRRGSSAKAVCCPRGLMFADHVCHRQHLMSVKEPACMCSWAIGAFLSHGKTDPPEGDAGCTPQQLPQCGAKLHLDAIYLHPWEQFLQEVFWWHSLSKYALSFSCCFWDLPFFLDDDFA